MKVEVADKHNMLSMCVATIVDIVGDRLRLRYDGLEAELNEDIFCHFLSSDIHPVGWSSLVGHTLQPPVGEQLMVLDNLDKLAIFALECPLSWYFRTITQFVNTDISSNSNI